MASFNTHLAIAKLYAKRNGVKDLNAFYKGNIDPDLTDNKDTTHYGTVPNTFENAWVRLNNKVDLAKFLRCNKLDNDLNLGRFLHLVADKHFFSDIFGEEALKNYAHDQFTLDLFYSYILGNQYLIKKYNLHEIDLDKIMDTTVMTSVSEAQRFRQTIVMKKQIQQVQKKIDNAIRLGLTPKNIIDNAKLDKFINKVASLDLQSTASHARKS